MRVIHLQEGLRRDRWLQLVEQHPRARNAAVIGGTGNVPSYPSLAAALEDIEAELAVVGGENAATRAIDALKAGLWVIMDAPPLPAATDVDRLRAACREHGRALLLPLHDPYAACRKRVRRFLESGALGAIGHVACVDRKPRDVTFPASWRAMSHFHGLLHLFAGRPSSVMARLQAGGQESIEAFLDLGDDVHIHYSSATSEVSQHSLWIEGSQGSLQTDGGSVWWRKRGWRFFIPVRLGRAEQLAPDGAAALEQAIAAADGGNYDAHVSLLPLALAAAMRASAEAGRAVALSEVLTASA